MKAAFPIIFASLPLISAACAHAPASMRPPAAALEEVCRVGSDVASAEGSVWMRAQSTEASGQFPAMVSAHAPDRLRMEVTNLLGGSEAIIEVNGRHYSVARPAKPSEAGRPTVQTGTDFWAGLPLRWSTELLLGRVPCPPAAERPGAEISISGTDLRVALPERSGRPAERFVYRLSEWHGTAWASSLHWERGASPNAMTVEFELANPEMATGSPRQWEVRSPQGNLKLRWKERRIERKSEKGEA